MTISLGILAWFLLGKIVYDKQSKVTPNFENAFGVWFAAIFAPLTVILYAIRAVFFEDWI